MKMNQCHRRGITPVISSLLMVAVVIVVGMSIWGVAYSATSIMQKDYFEEVMESIYKIKERFCIESVGYDESGQPTLKIWIFNYGSTDVNLTLVSLSGGGNLENQVIDVSLSSGDIVKIEIVPAELILTSGLTVSVEVKSHRNNKAYDSLIIP